MPLTAIEKDSKSRMEKAVEFLKSELRGVRTGRAHAGLVEHIRIEVASYGSVMELRELAGITVPDAGTLLVKPFDPGTLKDIEKGLQTSDLGISPMSDGKSIRLPIPPLSGERRQQLVQHVKKLAEAQKTAIRNIRREANKAIDAEEKAKTVSEDDAKNCKERIQKLVKHTEDEVDKLIAEKTKEIETV
ncbi:MAG: ribosome recycling factor [Phycisphaerales bacterium]|nr:MAG: ribosome recycling factor [Phycisphaerales bacterium]